MDDPEECRSRCDRNFLCTGFTVPVEDSSIEQCRTHTSVGVSGDGSSSYECFTKVYGKTTVWQPKSSKTIGT